MLWCRCVLSFKMGGRCVLSFKMGFRVCGSRGVRDVHVISCTRVVQCFSTFYKIGVARVTCTPHCPQQRNARKPNHATRISRRSACARELPYICPHSKSSLSKHNEPTAKQPSMPLGCLLYTSPSPRDKRQSRMPSSA